MSLAECTVMVVEDHEFQRRTMLQILANLGAGGLLEAADGESALALLGDGLRADVVVCDLDMPGMDGVEFLRHVSERSIDTAVVIASGLDEAVLQAAEATARAYGVEVLGVVRKPLTARRLLEVIGLHRPGAHDPHQPNGRHEAAWREALAVGTVGVRAVPRVDLLAGRTAGVRLSAARDGATEAGDDLGGHISADVATAVADLLLVHAATLLRADAVIDATLVLPTGAFDDLELADRLARRAEQLGVAAGRLCVALPRRPAQPVAPGRLDVLTRLRLRGFGLGVERYTNGDATVGGTGGLPLTEVALAPGAASDALAGGDAAALEAAVAALHEWGARVVATGCRAGDLEALAQAGCDRAESA